MEAPGSPSSASVVPPHPGEESLLRTGPDMASLRHRMERPARVGRVVLVMLGAVTASTGAASWVTTPGPLGLALAVFGGILLVLGVVQHLLYRRDLVHWPDEAFLWTDGVELVLHNGEVRGASWSDPDFALQLIARRAAAPIGREFVMIWLMDSKVPPVELSPQGFDQLRQGAANHGLELAQTRRGSRADSTQFIYVHPSSAATAATRASTRETTGPD